MSTEETIRKRLEMIVTKTSSARMLSPPGWWVGDKAAERKAIDDIESGREYWRSALRNAEAGLEYLERGDLEAAEMMAWNAIDFYVAALEIRVRPSDMAVLLKPAKRRGRKLGKNENNLKKNSPRVFSR